MSERRVIFAGTPEFGLASLTALVDAGVVPIAVLTQPDRPAGRGKHLTASPVKQFAEKLGVPVLQPATLRDESVVAALSALQPDIMIVAAYGLILPQDVLDIPRFGCLNVHASVLPRWRGAAPIQAAILAGDSTTGVSLMQMTAGLDCGPVFEARTVDIGANESAGELHDRLAALGGELLVTRLEDILAGRVEAVTQDESGATYAGKIQKADAELDWTLHAAELERRVRAYNPVPGSWFYIDDKRTKCWRAHSVDGVDAAPGAVVEFGREGIVIACGSGGLRLEELQLPGKRRVTAREFAAQIDLVGRTLG